MNESSLEEHQFRLLYKLAPIDIAINLVAICLFIAIYFIALPLNEIQSLLSVFGLICGSRLLLLYSARLITQNSNSSNILANSLLWIGAALTGLCWGALPLAVVYYGYGPVISESIIALIIAALVLSALAGSGLRNTLWLAYTLPAIGLPLGQAIWLNEPINSAIWGFLLAVALLVTRANTGSSGLSGQIKKISLDQVELKVNAGETQKQLSLYKHKLTELNNNLFTAEEKLEETQEQLNLAHQEINLLSASIDGVFFRCDTEGYITYISKHISSWIGISSTELLGTEFKHLFPSTEIYYAFTDAIDNKTGMTRDYRAPLRHRFEHEVWITLTVQYVKTGLNNRNGMIGVINMPQTHAGLSDEI